MTAHSRMFQKRQDWISRFSRWDQILGILTTMDGLTCISAQATLILNHLFPIGCSKILAVKNLRTSQIPRGWETFKKAMASHLRILTMTGTRIFLLRRA